MVSKHKACPPENHRDPPFYADVTRAVALIRSYHVAGTNRPPVGTYAPTEKLTVVSTLEVELPANVVVEL